ncbi:response regulator [Phocaeicola sp.]
MNIELKDINQETTTRTVLVVEDIPSQYLLLATILQRNHYNVLRAANGMEAVNMVKDQPVHIVLMDIEMPVMNGFTATREIRKFNFQIPIIAITASIFSSYEENAYSCGCNEFLTKPINLKSLITTVEKWSLKFVV